jgi:hypothetical protein
MTLVRGCARCGEEHEVQFKEFERPAEAAPGVTWTHWAPCPTNGDPILMRKFDPAAEYVAEVDAEMKKPQVFACRR